ncbi:hypothetical protein BP00DRAFT_481331 [Aspergillus indologenus CBS 114.80]|uniref:Uncharacterized protein n=1 Tax=Aspergillus indologenus CBS 114.80 TaxID=1450541 RepID=A0A2V5I2U1_9EURO|nr:hypothetical protein BP00DRAFT_481331 [Aspergillus indologenus CBS 114.80]
MTAAASESISNCSFHIMTRPSDQHLVEKDTDAHELGVDTNDQPPENDHVAGDGNDVEHGPDSAGVTASSRNQNLRRTAQAFPEDLASPQTLFRANQMSKDMGHAKMAENIHERPSSPVTFDRRLVRIKGLEDEVDSLRNELGSVKYRLTVMQEAVNDYEFDNHVTRDDLSKTMLEVTDDRHFESRMITNELHNLGNDYQRLTQRIDYLQRLVKDYERDCSGAKRYAKALEARIDRLEAKIGTQKSPHAEHRQIPGRALGLRHLYPDNFARLRGGFFRAEGWEDRARVGNELGHDADFLAGLGNSREKNRAGDGLFESRYGLAPQWGEEILLEYESFVKVLNLYASEHLKKVEVKLSKGLERAHSKAVELANNNKMEEAEKVCKKYLEERSRSQAAL